jgi:hypothetical protein
MCNLRTALQELDPSPNTLILAERYVTQVFYNKKCHIQFGHISVPCICLPLTISLSHTLFEEHTLAAFGPLLLIHYHTPCSRSTPLHLSPSHYFLITHLVLGAYLCTCLPLPPHHTPCSRTILGQRCPLPDVGYDTMQPHVTMKDL